MKIKVTTTVPDASDDCGRCRHFTYKAFSDEFFCGLFCVGIRLKEGKWRPCRRCLKKRGA